MIQTEIHFENRPKSKERVKKTPTFYTFNDFYTYKPAEWMLIQITQQNTQHTIVWLIIKINIRVPVVIVINIIDSTLWRVSSQSHIETLDGAKAPSCDVGEGLTRTAAAPDQLQSAFITNTSLQINCRWNQRQLDHHCIQNTRIYAGQL